MQDLQHFKNDIALILSRERLDTYDSLEQYKENLKLISFITPKISKRKKKKEKRNHAFFDFI